MNITDIHNILRKYAIPTDIINLYNEPHRYYHNINHIIDMLNNAVELNLLDDELALAIIFHDIIYDPKKDDNEQKSANLAHSYTLNSNIEQAILDTKSHIPKNELSKKLCKLDLDISYSDLDKFIDFENKIFKEYQWVDYKIYKQKKM